MRYYILMAFEQDLLVKSWHFKAKETTQLAEDVLRHLLAHDKQSETHFIAADYARNETGSYNYKAILFDFLDKLADACANEGGRYYKLYEREGDTNGAAFVELEDWTGSERKRNTDVFLNRLTEASDAVLLVKLWKFNKDVSQYRASENIDDLYWAKSFSIIRRIEKEGIEPRLMSNRRKPETVCVYYSGDNPIYVHRRSTIDGYYEWLVNVNDFYLLGFELKEWLQEEAQFNAERVRYYNAKLAEEQALTAAERAFHQKEVEAAWLADRSRLSELARAKYARQQAAWIKFEKDCQYHANQWFRGYTFESQRNHQTWLLAEQEDEAEFMADFLNWEDKQDPSV